MEVEDAIKRKELLEKTIQKEIEQFELDTKLTVERVEIFRAIPYTGGFKNFPLLTITTKVEL